MTIAQYDNEYLQEEVAEILDRLRYGNKVQD